ncbi:MAG TPA: hypothetical protein VHQ20_00010 [Patescibacteria group bacterium]|jgi:hypothetical protein|nr:hypothetical protein [Patescibacteria group bacterium]
MLETNTQNNPSLISLARAAELTGYHQDYLGQLCRLGRLPAKKVGRNWFTSKEALQSLSTQPREQQDEVAQAQAQEETREVTDVIKELRELEQAQEQSRGQSQAQAQPQADRTILVSQVDGLPISIRSVTTQVHPVNNVQSIATNMRLQALQREVLQLRQMLTDLIVEVSRHEELLQGRNFADIWRKQDSLRHQYVSNFDFNPVGSQQADSETEPVRIPILQSEPQAPRISIITWIYAAGAMAILAFLITGALTGELWGNQSPVQTVYYHSPASTLSEPAVAGDSTQETSQTLPTGIPSSGSPNVVQ